jgi:hypothetical protein
MVVNIQFMTMHEIGWCVCVCGGGGGAGELDHSAQPNSWGEASWSRLSPMNYIARGGGGPASFI